MCTTLEFSPSYRSKVVVQKTGQQCYLTLVAGGIVVNPTITKILFLFEKGSSDGPNMWSVNGTLLRVTKDNIEAKHATC